jgi:hypothetical protein
LHAHENVQRNIAILLEHLAKNYDFRLVCVEGACGPGDLSLLWSIPYRTRMKFCESLLDRAYLTGAELAAASRPGIGLDLWGVDVASLYRLQWRAAKSNFTMRPQALLQIVDFRKRMRRTYAPLISRDLLRLLRLRGAASNADVFGSKYGEYLGMVLVEIAERKRLLLPAVLWEKIARHQQLATPLDPVLRKQMQKRIDECFSEVNEALSKVDNETRVSFLVAYLFEARLKLMNQTLKSRIELRHSVEALLFKLPAEQRREIGAADASFRQKFAALPEEIRQAYEQSRAPSLWDTLSDDDREMLWDDVARSCCTARLDTVALRLETACAATQKLLQFKFQPHESLRFVERDQEEFCREVMNDIRTLNLIAAEAGSSAPLPLDPVITLRSIWSTSEVYYQTARQRSTAMARNILLTMRKRGLDRVAAVSGGFHSKAMSAWLTDVGQMATIIVNPRVVGSLSVSEHRYSVRVMEEE